MDRRLPHLDSSNLYLGTQTLSKDLAQVVRVANLSGLMMVSSTGYPSGGTCPFTFLNSSKNELSNPAYDSATATLKFQDSRFEKLGNTAII